MLDVLAYLFQVFHHAEETPDLPRLTHELAEAGFEDDEIGEALAWLDEVDQVDFAAYAPLAGRHMARQLHPQELALLSAEAIGYWFSLERSGALDAAERELVLDRVHGHAPLHTGLERLQRLVLLAVWPQRHARAGFLIEDILFGRSDAVLH
ncbi:DUF494 domain-containing protein [Chitiniphilus purpureus]|uniref:Protein Smg homolog n=1 Tax=Chitiniphilus purpureus TaxID=2981137 RepID=A0ABY6DMX8_9NEIS|nr:DUF494 domain-containing protein [Chitiniphilus sp. CD1]UXY15038.1 DUF494 domain-containing protein [Chitiniphilus sp. CD1]